MIQELFGASAATLLNQDQNLPISTPIEPSPSPSPSPSSSTTTTTTIPPTTTTTSDHQKLRCPRCDSSHTKFCYYNNYNLTQPRHFCKTCRRYWTKGGALRNVPIGGGCRKNKQTTITTVAGKPISTAGKLKSMVSSELGQPSFMHGFELDQSNHNPNIIWSHPPQTSHLLSLFRATQNPNPNFTPNSITHMKDHNFMAGSQMGNIVFESLCTSLWRNNQQDHQNHHQDQDQGQGFMSSGSHEAVQNQQLRSSSSSTANYYHHEETGPLILGSNVANIMSSSTSSSTILDSAPVIAGGDLGFWNQTLPWTSDLSASNDSEGSIIN